MSQPITPRPAPPKPEDVKAQYGFVAMLAQAIPELNSILDRATRESWTTDRFTMEVANSNWFKTTPDGQRQWITQQISDPATANMQMIDGASQITAKAAQMGFYGNVFGAQEAQQFWVYAKVHGLNDDQLKGYLFNTLAPRTADMPDISGEYGNLLNQMRQVSAKYGYAQTPETEAELRGWASGMGQNGGTTGPLAGWTSKMQNFATVKYSAYADRIKAGETVQDIAQPFVQSYQKLLEQSPGEGFRDPLIERAIQGQVVDGKPVVPALWQFEQQIRDDPRWATTQNARQTTAQTLQAIGKTFGMVG